MLNGGASSSPALGGFNHEEFNSAWDLKQALFGLTDRHTSVLTCLPHRERIAAPRMSLFPEWAKKVLFVDSKWVEEFDKFRQGEGGEGNAIGKSPSADSTPAAVPLTSGFISEGNNLPPAKAISTPQLPSLSGEGPSKDEKNLTEAGGRGILGFSTSPASFPPLYADVLGRPKIVRCLLYNFLADPTYWRDGMDELLLLAAEKVRTLGGESDDGGAGFEANRWASEHLLRPLESVVFYSPWMREVLWRVLDLNSKSFVGPISVWYAFVMAHRQDAALLRSPHQPPFSFSEVKPMLTPHDLDYCRFDLFQTDSTLPSREFKEEAKPQELPRGGPLDALTEAEWKGMTETQQIKLLFGKDAVSELAAATMTILKGNFPEDGDIFICNPPSTDLRIGGEGGAGSNSDPSSDCSIPPPSMEAGGDLAPQTMTSEAMLEQRRQEALRSYGYELDQFLLGIIECTPNFALTKYAAALPQNPAPRYEEPQRKAAALRARKGYTPRDQYYSNGLFRNAKNGEVEDVHLMELWNAFQDADINTLLDHWVHVRNRLPIVQREIRAEMAAQAAFMLLFFSTDEVRAVTNPKDTYYRLWGQHRELVELLMPAGGKVASRFVSHAEKSSLGASTTATEVKDESPWVPFPSFESLPLNEKVSYACFGCDHLPTTINNNNSPQGDLIQCPKDAIEKPDPFTLFSAYCTVMNPAHVTFLYNDDNALERIPIRDLTPAQREVAYQSLMPLQKLAIYYCFSRSLEKMMNVERLRTLRLANTGVNSPTGVEIAHEEISTTHHDENELTGLTKRGGGSGAEAKLSGNHNGEKEFGMTVEQRDANPIPRAMSSLRVDDVHEGNEGLGLGIKTTFFDKSATHTVQKTTENDSSCHSGPSVAIPTSALTDMLIALTNSIYEAKLGDQLQQIANTLVQLVVEGLKVNASKMARPRSPSLNKRGDNAASSQIRKKGRPKKNKV
ncbi:unnamed protein product [Phytomonas sp. Hart1]|nr:unnamed protein product [Phytomonas sp. Hart1]|eukprot:CCW68705.1 unnamed protein product [Phytomonas sp. isolate Hart1]